MEAVATPVARLPVDNAASASRLFTLSSRPHFPFHR